MWSERGRAVQNFVVSFVVNFVEKKLYQRQTMNFSHESLNIYQQALAPQKTLS